MFKKIKQLLFSKSTNIHKDSFDMDQRNYSFGTIFLGIILGGFLLWQTESSLWQVSSFLDKPNCPLSCSSLLIDYTSEWFYEKDQQQIYSKRRGNVKKVSVFEEYPELKMPFDRAKKDFEPLNYVRENIQNLERQLRDLEKSNQNNREDYQVGLLENMADTDARIFNNDNTRNKIQNSKKEIEIMESKISAKKRNENDLFKVYQKTFNELKKVHENSLSKYNTQKRIFEIKLFLLQFLITFPLFFIGNLWYRKAKEKNSKYAILPLVLMVVGGITFLQILMVYGSSWIPFEFFGGFFKWLLKLPFGRLIIHYLFVFLGIAVFGALIVNLQRRLFSQKRIALKRLNKKNCPFCAFPIEFSGNFCCGCGEELKITCKECGKKTLKMLSNCQNCGKNPKE